MLGWEKRAARRVPVNCPLRIVLADGQECMGLAHDLSVDGISFECALGFAPAAEARVELLPPPDAHTLPLQGVIEVIRCDPLSSGGYLIAAALRVTG